MEVTNSKYSACIFDLDGTLLNTISDLTASCNHALRVHNMPEHTTEDVRKFVGNGVRKLMERAVPADTPDEEFEKVFATFRSHYMEHSLDHTCPYDGVVDMLSRLKSAGMPMAIVSNKFMAATKELCSHFFSEFISVAIGESETIRRKPSPDTVLEATRLLGVKPEECVYIGDSDVDIETALNSGMPSISVLWGFRDKDFLVAHGAQRFASTPDEVVEMVVGSSNL